MQKIDTPDAPKPAGHYSQAVVHNGVVYVAGQLAADPHDPGAPVGDIGDQARQVMKNIGAILEAAGSGLDLLLHVTIFVTDSGHWSAVNEAFAEALGEHRPARAIVPVSSLSRGRLLEVTATAAVR